MSIQRFFALKLTSQCIPRCKPCISPFRCTVASSQLCLCNWFEDNRDCGSLPVGIHTGNRGVCISTMKDISIHGIFTKYSYHHFHRCLKDSRHLKKNKNNQSLRRQKKSCPSAVSLKTHLGQPPYQYFICILTVAFHCCHTAISFHFTLGNHTG